MSDTSFKFNLWTWLFGDGKEDWTKASSRAWKIFVVFAVVMLIIFGVLWVKEKLFGKSAGNNNKQVQIALPWSGVKEQTSTNEQTVIMPQKTRHIGAWAGLDSSDKDGGGGFKGIVGVIGWLDF
jgi:hypothetical protein